MPRGTVTGVWILSCLRRDSLWLSRNRFKVRRRWTTRSLLCEDFIESNCRRKWWWDPSWPISTIRRRNLPFRVTVWIWVLILSSSTVWSGWTSWFRSKKMVCQLKGNNIRVMLKFILRIYCIYIPEMFIKYNFFFHEYAQYFIAPMKIPLYLMWYLSLPKSDSWESTYRILEVLARYLNLFERASTEVFICLQHQDLWTVVQFDLQIRYMFRCYTCHVCSN